MYKFYVFNLLYNSFKIVYIILLNDVFFSSSLYLTFLLIKIISIQYTHFQHEFQTKVYEKNINRIIAKFSL